MRSGDAPADDDEFIKKLCAACGQNDAPHRRRSDDPTKPRSRCIPCSAGYNKRWRDEINWQRRKLYNTWRGVIDRCTNKFSFTWKRYGGATPPVLLCKRWQGAGGFERFVADVGDPPSRSHQLDRKRRSRGYYASNVKWSTWEEQCRNRRSSILLSAVDPRPEAQPHPPMLTLCIAEWARIVKVSASTIRNRKKRGWQDWEAIFTPTTGGEGCPF